MSTTLFKLRDRVYFEYAGANEQQKGMGTIVGLGNDPIDREYYYVHKDGEAPYEHIDHEAWIIEPFNDDIIVSEEIYNSPLYQALK